MKKLVILACFLLVGCAYSPRYYVVKDSYNTNTYSPTYSPSNTQTYPTSTEISYPRSSYSDSASKQTQKKRKVKKTKYIYK